MSETVHYRGTATKVYQDLGKTVEQMAEKISKERGHIELPSWADNWIEFLCDMYDSEYFYHPKSMALFKITKEDVQEDDDITTAKEIKKDSFAYELRYYNGSAGFEECLEEALDKVI